MQVVQIGFSAQRAFFLPPLAVFWNKTVLGLWPVQELALRNKTRRTECWAEGHSHHEWCFYCFCLHHINFQSWIMINIESIWKISRQRRLLSKKNVYLCTVKPKQPTIMKIIRWQSPCDGRWRNIVVYWLKRRWQMTAWQLIRETLRVPRTHIRGTRRLYYFYCHSVMVSYDIT